MATRADFPAELCTATKDQLLATKKLITDDCPICRDDYNIICRVARHPSTVSGGATTDTAFVVGEGHEWFQLTAVENEGGSIPIPAQAEYKLYERVGKQLMNNEVVLTIKKDIEGLAISRGQDLPLPFGMVAAPSGSGKSQLPFSLREAGMPVVHLVVGVNYGADDVQLVYREEYMRYHSSNLREAVVKDLCSNIVNVNVKSDELKCVSLFWNNTQLFTVEWLCKMLNINPLPSYTVGALKAHIVNRRNHPEGGWPVVFLDEIYSRYSSDWDLKHVRFLRNVLRTVHLVTVLMGTNSSPTKLLDNRRKSWSRGSGNDVLWCRLITRLPKITLATAECLQVTAAVARLRDGGHASFAYLLESCMTTSNCLFVRMFAEAVLAFDSGQFALSAAELVDFVCGTVSALLLDRKDLSQRGQLCLQFNAYQPPLKGGKRGASRKLRMGAALLVEHFARLAGGDRDVWLKPRSSRLVVHKPGGVVVKNVLRAEFEPACEDPLLYLVCGGGVDSISGKARRPFQRDSADAADATQQLTSRTALEDSCALTVEPGNRNAPYLNPDMMEMLASMSIGTASRLCGLRGATLDTFLPLLCAEVLSLDPYKRVKWKSQKSLCDIGAASFGTRVIPFIGMHTSPWPKAVAALEGCHVADMKRPENAAGVNLLVCSRTTRSSGEASTAAATEDTVSDNVVERFSAECKNYNDPLPGRTLEAVLRKVPDTSILHFVFCNTAQENYFTTCDGEDSKAHHPGTNIAVVHMNGRCKMLLKQLSENMVWVDWEKCKRLVIVLPVQTMSEQCERGKKRSREEQTEGEEDNSSRSKRVASDI